MSGLLRLANEFIDRMMNPAFGSLVNDEYAMRLGELLSDDEASARLESEMGRLTRVDELSAHTWMWLLSMPGSDTALGTDLLLELARAFQSATFRVAVIDCATRGRPRMGPTEDITLEEVPTLDQIDDRFLSGLVQSAVRTPRAQVTTNGVDVGSFPEAETLLVALLTVDRRDCHQVARALLHYEWPGQRALLAFFESRTTAMDDESRNRWLRLRPAREE
jgi:hypothetical protein